MVDPSLRVMAVVPDIALVVEKEVRVDRDVELELSKVEGIKVETVVLE